MATLLVRISVGLISIVVTLCVKAVEMNAHELSTFRASPKYGFSFRANATIRAKPGLCGFAREVAFARKVKTLHDKFNRF